MFQFIGKMYSEEYSVSPRTLSKCADVLFVTNSNKLARICYIRVAIFWKIPWEKTQIVPPKVDMYFL